MLILLQIILPLLLLQNTGSIGTSPFSLLLQGGCMILDTHILFLKQSRYSILMIFITKVTSVAAKLSPIAQCAVCPKQLKIQKQKQKMRI